MFNHPLLLRLLPLRSLRFPIYPTLHTPCRDEGNGNKFRGQTTSPDPPPKNILPSVRTRRHSNAGFRMAYGRVLHAEAHFIFQGFPGGRLTHDNVDEVALCAGDCVGEASIRRLFGINVGDVLVALNALDR